MRGGRQELLFGKERLVSPLDWANTGRTFDGAAAVVEAGPCKITGFWTRPVIVDKFDFNENDSDAAFFGFYTESPAPILAGARIESYWLGLSRDGQTFNGTTGDEDRHTVGARIFGKVDDYGVDYDIGGAYQFGEVGSNDISAFMLTCELGRTLANLYAKPRVHLSIDYASGDPSEGGDVNTFNQLFPLGHAYMGWIDIVARQNIIDVQPGLTLKPNPRTVAKLNLHLFWRADTDDGLYNAGGGLVRAGSAGNDAEVGQEIDLLLKYKFNRHLVGIFGYSRLFAGDFIEESAGASGNDKDIDFFYAQLQFTF